MRILWICGLLFLVSIVAYGQISVSPSSTADSRLETKKSPSITAAMPLLNTPIDVLARNASFDMPAPGPTRNDDHLSANLSTYLFWHKTWNDAAPASTAEQLGVCTE